MIYITQLIFILPGKEKEFHAFEDRAIPLMEKYKGRMIYRIRPDRSDFITQDGDLPYEIHFLSFPSEQDLSDFMADDSRQEFIYLKNESVSSMLLVKGKQL